MIQLVIFGAACLLGADRAAAADIPAPQPVTAGFVPASAWFLGAGVSYDWLRYKDQYVYATGISQVYEDGEQVGGGAATGGTGLSLGSSSSFAPALQLGFYRHFEASNWLWGTKFTYAYVGSSSTKDNLLVPQYGAPGSTTDFDGHLLVHAYKVELKDQTALIPFIGRSYERGFVYAGAGPTLSRTQSSMSGVVGFADINDVRTDVTGDPVNLSSSNWVWGGAATVGATYFLDASWFIDLSYTYTASEKTSNRFFKAFDNPTSTYEYTGVGFGHYSGSVDTQAITLSINRAF